MHKIVFTSIFVFSFLMYGSGRSSATTYESGNFYEDHASKYCTDSTVCMIDFSMSPSGQSLTLTHASCSTTSGSGPLINLILTYTDPSKKESNRLIHLANAPAVYAPTTYFVTSNTSIEFKMGPNRTPRVYSYFAPSQSAIAVDCTLTGTLSSQ